jgi:SSS family solute:Na+ symporter
MEKIGGGVMYQYLQNVQSYIAPPVTAVFLLGVIWKRVNSEAAITTLLTGLGLLILRLGSEIYYQKEILSGENIDNIAYAFATINFAHMAIFMFLFSVIICITVSLAFSPPDYKRIIGLSFGTLTEEQKAEHKNSYDIIDILLSIVLIILVIGILAYFT